MFPVYTMDTAGMCSAGHLTALELVWAQTVVWNVDEAVCHEPLVWIRCELDEWYLKTWVQRPGICHTAISNEWHNWHIMYFVFCFGCRHCNLQNSMKVYTCSGMYVVLPYLGSEYHTDIPRALPAVPGSKGSPVYMHSVKSIICVLYVHLCWL